MNFASDNVVGASAPVLEAIVRHNGGAMPAYGADPLTLGLTPRFRGLFDHADLAVFPVATGTAANAAAWPADWRDDYPNLARLSAEEIAQRRAENDRLKQVAQGVRHAPLATTGGGS